MKKFMLEMMLWLLLLIVAGAKKKMWKKKRKTDGFKKKLMIPESDTSECQNVQNLKSNKKYETYL